MIIEIIGRVKAVQELDTLGDSAIVTKSFLLLVNVCTLKIFLMLCNWKDRICRQLFR